ncbi:uncharacterized protein N0V89_008456 [Didymosphaeria variabile]|uniref:Uncharacterized protein n=1 Tax=Didymosphaeria variabile TaxID=1932322 RepID=A0A9W9C9B9_9PLEO|nr:uncharacterized protein N0V89_008456 [Didymosphaeria variabile]KAJ4349837.1 hypothetical protein N0V89_008456 [Didymosphaeria variabile]
MASTANGDDDDKTTTLAATSKSTLFITKTIMSKPPISSLPGETLSPITTSPASSTDAISISEPNHTEPAVSTQDHTEPTMPVHVTSKLTPTVLETLSVHPHGPIPNLQSWLSLHSSLILTNPLRPSASSSAIILTNPLRPSITASGIWPNTTTSGVVVPSFSDASVTQTSPDNKSKSTLRLTMSLNTPTTAVPVSVSVSTDGIATSSAINSTLTLGTLSVTSSFSGYSPSSVSQSSTSLADDPRSSVSGNPIEFTGTYGNDPPNTQPTPHPGLPLVGNPRPSTQVNVTVMDDRPTVGFAQFKASVSDNFISLPSDTDISWSIAGDESTVTNMEVFPTITPDATPTDMEVFPTIKPDATSAALVLTDGTFFSSVTPPYPIAAPAKRQDGKHERSVHGTISKVFTTTTVTLANSTVTSTQEMLPTNSTGSTGSTDTASEPYPGATTQSLSKNGASNTQPAPARVVLVVLALRLAALF